MKLQIVEALNKKGKTRYRIEEKFIFWWVSLELLHPNLKSEFKKLEKAQKYVTALKNKKIISLQ